MGWQVAQETWPLAEILGSLNKALPCSIRALFVCEAAGSGNMSKARTTRRFMAISIPVLLVVIDSYVPLAPMDHKSVLLFAFTNKYETIMLWPKMEETSCNSATSP